MIGHEDEAHELFDKLLGLRNDVGLLSEEYDPRYGRQVGNTPQAFSHVPAHPGRAQPGCARARALPAPGWPQRARGTRPAVTTSPAR